MFARYTCTYCGDRASSRDHVLARSWDSEKNSDAWVPACRPCNSKLGRKPLFSIGSRAGYIAMRLEDKQITYREPWSSDDLKTVRGRLKRFIVGSEIMREIHLQRLAFARAVEAMAPDVNYVRIECGLRESKRWKKFLAEQIR